MKTKILLSCILFLLICFTGCAREGTADAEVPPDTEVTIATFDGSGSSLNGMLAPVLMGDNLYFWKGSWDRDSKRWSDTVIYRKAGSETEAEEIAILGDRELLCFTVDEGQNLYYLYGEYSGEGKDLYFQKDASDGSVTYNVPVPAEAGTQILYDIEQSDRISQAAADRLGRVIFRSPSGSLYLFDEKGGFLCTGSDGWDGEAFQGAEKGLANAGDAGIYTFAVMEGKVLLSPVNMADAGLGRMMELPIETEVSINVYSGYDKGILVSDHVGLWESNPEETGRELLFDWDNAGLKNYEIDKIGLLEDGRLYMMVTREGRQEKELAYIETMTAADVPEVQTIAIGSLGGPDSVSGSALAAAAEEFNHYNRQYQVEIKYYGLQDLHLELLRGEGPDGFQLFRESELAANGVLEDLSPYFAGSGVVQESDLFPSVINAGTRDGKLLYLFMEFHLRGIVVKKGATDDGVWTPEEYLGLGLQNPEALLTPQMNTYMVMEDALYADMGSFVDWQAGKCFFDSERFINILEGVRQVTDGKQMPEPMEVLENSCQWLHDGRIMTTFFNIQDMYKYMAYMDAYGDFADFVGYPNSEDVPYYRFMPDYVLGMNSASENKEGVWAFLEFLLSEDYQKTVQSFPVRRDSFEEHVAGQVKEWEGLVKNYQPGSSRNPVSQEIWQEYAKLEEQDIEFLTYLVENAYWDETFTDVYRIISEEAGSFWSGDKTAEETARIMQNRVQLYLDE